MPEPSLEVAVPVSSYVGNIDGVDDVVLSLYGIAPTEKLRFKQAPGALQYDKAKLVWGQSSVDILAEMGITSVVTISEKFQGDYYCYNAQVLAKTSVENTLAGTLIPRATVGIGFQIGVIAFNIKNEAKVSSPGLLSASSTLNVASSVYQVVVMGAGVEAMPILKPLLVASTSDFDVQTFQVLGAAQAALSDYIDANSSNLIPALLSVTLDLNGLTDALYPAGTGDYLTDALAQTYAFERAYNNSTLKDALANSKVRENNLNTKIIEYIYKNILGLSESEKPTPAARDLCHLILVTGRY